MRPLAFALLLLLVACDSESPAPPAAAAVDPDRPCAFATSDEIAEAVGGRGGPRSEVEGHDLTALCHYEVGPPYSAVGLHVEEVSEAEFQGRMDEDRLNTDPLEGVGALAFTSGGVAVSVWDGDRAVTASLQHFGNADDTRDALQELAELIASKL